MVPSSSLTRLTAAATPEPSTGDNPRSRQEGPNLALSAFRAGLVILVAELDGPKQFPIRSAQHAAVGAV